MAGSRRDCGAGEAALSRYRPSDDGISRHRTCRSARDRAGGYSGFCSRDSSARIASAGDSSSRSTRCTQRRDRQLDAVLRGELHHRVDGLHAFDDLTDLRDRVLERHAAAERKTEAPVAREIAGAGQHEIAETGEAHQRFGARAERGAEAHHFGEAARDQAGARVESQLHAIGDAGRDREHVLHRAAELGAEHVAAGVRAEERRVQHLRDSPRECRRRPNAR